MLQRKGSFCSCKLPLPRLPQPEGLWQEHNTFSAFTSPPTSPSVQFPTFTALHIYNLAFHQLVSKHQTVNGRWSKGLNILPPHRLQHTPKASWEEPDQILPQNTWSVGGREQTPGVDGKHRKEETLAVLLPLCHLCSDMGFYFGWVLNSFCPQNSHQV